MNGKLRATTNIYYVLTLRKVFEQSCILFGSMLFKKVPLTKIG